MTHIETVTINCLSRNLQTLHSKNWLDITRFPSAQVAALMCDGNEPNLRSDAQRGADLDQTVGFLGVS